MRSTDTPVVVNRHLDYTVFSVSVRGLTEEQVMVLFRSFGTVFMERTATVLAGRYSHTGYIAMHPDPFRLRRELDAVSFGSKVDFGRIFFHGKAAEYFTNPRADDYDVVLAGNKANRECAEWCMRAGAAIQSNFEATKGD